MKITDPNAQSVISALKSVSGIISAEAATEDNDPFAMLGTEDGYTSCIFFESDLVPAELPVEEETEEFLRVEELRRHFPASCYNRVRARS